MSMGKIVIIEGTSCVGKTTLCKKLEKKGWIVLPEAIRYLEKETGKLGDSASPIPNSQQEEEYYQDQLYRIEKQKIIQANDFAQEGRNVILDKSFLATVATAKVLEKEKGFNGTFKRAYLKYCQLLKELKNGQFIECDKFLLLVADYQTITKRNKKRNHILDGIWICEETVKIQREVLEKLTRYVVGLSMNNLEEKKVIDTTGLTEHQVLKKFEEFLNDRII